MDVYEFDKCLLDRLDESMNVLSWKDQPIPASQVRQEWSYYIELQIEPTGWQGLWRIPRVICEELHVRFPTVVFGMIEQVLFKELKAVFVVQAVQDEGVHLPERHEVALEDLWPTVSQENTELNVERTADCLDRLRFFYTNVWMPWDNDSDDDLNWVEKHLESRIRFCYDMRKHSIKRALTAHIRTLLTEARYIQQRRDYLELDLSDNDELDDSVDKSQITDLMRLHLRLAIIRSEIEMLENPELRRIYEEINFDNEKRLKDTRNNMRMQGKLQDADDRRQSEHEFYIVTLCATLDKQMEILKLTQKLIPKNALVHICPSLQDVLSVCNASDNLYLSPGRHTIKFLEYLNDNGSITGLIEMPNSKSSLLKGDLLNGQKNAIVMSTDNDSILLVFDGDFTLENLVFDCHNIRTGILVKNGALKLKNCHLIGDGKSSTQQGIVCFGGGGGGGCPRTNVILENCSIENFSTGIALNEGAWLLLNKTMIKNCAIGIDVNADGICNSSRNLTKIDFSNGTHIWGSTRYGISIDSIQLNANVKYLALKKLSDLKDHSSSNLPWNGECTFTECKTNIHIINKDKKLMSSQSAKYIFDETDVAAESMPK